MSCERDKHRGRAACGQSVPPLSISHVSSSLMSNLADATRAWVPRGRGQYNQSSGVFQGGSVPARVRVRVRVLAAGCLVAERHTRGLSEGEAEQSAALRVGQEELERAHQRHRACIRPVSPHSRFPLRLVWSQSDAGCDPSQQHTSDGQTMDSLGSRCKIVVVGDTQCGKTALLHVFAKDCYPEVRKVPFFNSLERRREFVNERRAPSLTCIIVQLNFSTCSAGYIHLTTDRREREGEQEERESE